MVNTRFIINEQESSLADHWFNREESTFNPITYIKKLDISLHLKPNITKDELNQYKAKEKLKEMLKYDEDRKTGLHILSVVVKKYPDFSIIGPAIQEEKNLNHKGFYQASVNYVNYTDVLNNMEPKIDRNSLIQKYSNQSLLFLCT